MSLADVADHQPPTPGKLSFQRTADVLIEILHERGRFHLAARADIPRLVTLIHDGDRASLVRAAALIVAKVEGMDVWSAEDSQPIELVPT
jgi:hypothetical protein